MSRRCGTHLATVSEEPGGTSAQSGGAAPMRLGVGVESEGHKIYLASLMLVIGFMAGPFVPEREPGLPWSESRYRKPHGFGNCRPYSMQCLARTKSQSRVATKGTIKDSAPKGLHWEARMAFPL